MAALRAPEFPQTGVRLIEERYGPFTECLKPLKLRDVAGARQPLVEKTLLRGGVRSC